VPQKIQLTLNQMEAGQSGTVVQILGGTGLMGHRGRGFMRHRGTGFTGRRLEALGIRPGRKVTKISSMLFRGPVTLRVGNAQVAIGFGMANRIIAEVDVSA